MTPSHGTPSPVGESDASSELDFTGKTTIFQPGELSALRDKAEGTPARDIPTVVPAPAASSPGAASGVAVIKWPSGASTRIGSQLNIGRDPRFCPFAAELASDFVSRRHAVLETCAE